jgi:hypothetical protein
MWALSKKATFDRGAHEMCGHATLAVEVTPCRRSGPWAAARPPTIGEEEVVSSIRLQRLPPRIGDPKIVETCDPFGAFEKFDVIEMRDKPEHASPFASLSGSNHPRP